MASANTPSVADAGGDRSTFPYVNITLTGSATDPDGDPIVQWHWSLDSQPPGSFADLSPTWYYMPTFWADTEGQYIVSLYVSDSTDWSLPDTITITVAENQPPVAVIAADVLSGCVPLTVHFDGSGSYDPDGVIVSYVWISGDGMSSSMDISPAFVYRSPGTYLAELVVKDEFGEGGIDSVSITVYRTIYVDVTASGANDGWRWADAYNHLQDALREASSSFLIHEIRVAEGIYLPDVNTTNPVGTGDRTATFQLINNGALYGGFPSGGGDWSERDPNRYETILSGDIGLQGNADNSYHVVTGSGTDTNAILDGFIITGGNANTSGADSTGGGMINNPNGSPTVTNCTFRRNSAVYGGGMYNFDHSNPRLTNCHFTGNSASYGGGMNNRYYSTPTLTNLAFSGNTASSDGGGMYNHLGSDVTVINCTFSGNSAGGSGGGMFNHNNNPTLTNCILWGNSDGSGMNEAAQIQGGTPMINYCCVQGWIGSLGGGGNNGDDPLFKDADGPDDIPGTEDDNLELVVGSPCIDAGDNNSVPPDIDDLDRDGITTIERIPLDLAGRARFTNDPLKEDIGVPTMGYPEIVEMGAYERYEFCGSGVYQSPPGDITGPTGVPDCEVNFYDFAFMALHWMEYTGPE